MQSSYTFEDNISDDKSDGTLKISVKLSSYDEHWKIDKRKLADSSGSNVFPSTLSPAQFNFKFC
jgi:hypothetical protein